MSDPTSDIYSALLGGPPTDAEKQATLVQALRRRNQLGLMNQLSGDPVLNPMGATMAKGADTQAQELGQQRIANQQLAQSAAYQQGELEHGKGELENSKNVLAESIREHNLQFQAKKMEMGEDGEGSDRIDAMAKKIASYDFQPLTTIGQRNPKALNIMSRVMELNPDYDATQYGAKKKAITDFGSGTKGDQTRRFNVGLSHLDTLDKLIDAMGGTDIKLYNRLKQEWQTQTGKPAPSNYQAAADLAADEVSAAVIGQGRSAGALADRQGIQAKYAAANSPTILHTNNDTYRQMMSDQLRGLEGQYKAATGLGDFRGRYLSGKSKALLDAQEAQQGAGDATPPVGGGGWAIKLVK